MESLASVDTVFDRILYRPPARLAVRVLMRTAVTPNQLTCLSLVPAAVSALFFARGEFTAGLLAALFFYLWALLDHLDGELARAKKLASERGRLLDDFFDDISSAIILVGVFCGAIRALAYPKVLAMSVLFAGGLVLNAVSSGLVLRAKRRARSIAAGDPALLTAQWVKGQKLLDHVTGREPFYLLITLYLVTLHQRGTWPAFFLAVLIAGSYALALGYFTASFILRRKNP